MTSPSLYPERVIALLETYRSDPLLADDLAIAAANGQIGIGRIGRIGTTRGDYPTHSNTVVFARAPEAPPVE